MSTGETAALAVAAVTCPSDAHACCSWCVVLLELTSSLRVPFLNAHRTVEIRFIINCIIKFVLTYWRETWF
jgi:hypothetical protein